MNKRQIKKLCSEFKKALVESNGNDELPAVLSSDLPVLSNGNKKGFIRRIVDPIARIAHEEEIEIARIQKDTKVGLTQKGSDHLLRKADIRASAIEESYQYTQNLFVGRENLKSECESKILEQEDLTQLKERIMESKDLTVDQKINLIHEVVLKYMVRNNNHKN